MSGDLPSIDQPSSARIYDYFLGGENNYAIDREFAKRQEELVPDIGACMRSNRAFVGRAVKAALAAGIRQFVDIGSGLPSQGQAHEVADAVAPGEARVVYVDKEPIAHAHSEILLDRHADPERHHALIGDFLDTDALWRSVLQTGLIDPAEPTCLLVTALLHFMSPAQQPEQAMAFYRNKAAPGSMLVLSHGYNELGSDEADTVAANYARTTDQATLRDRTEFAPFFGDWELLDPGIVWTVEWRPDGTEKPWWGSTPARANYLAGVARKPGPSAGHHS